MTWSLAGLYRFPVKGLGGEALDRVRLETGRPMPHDRAWAIAHGGASEASASGWIDPGSLLNPTHIPALAQVETAYDPRRNVLSLRYPDRPFVSLEPGTPHGNTALTKWIAPLAEDIRPGPYRVCQAPGVAFTDFEETHLSIASIRSRAILEQVCGQSLDVARFRMNIWLDRMDPWAEFDLVDRVIEIGAVQLKVIDRCTRCNATNASPETGRRDAQIPAILKQRYGHMDFGVYAQVISGGEIKPGDLARAI